MGLSDDRAFNTNNNFYFRKMKDFFRRQIKSQTIEFFNSHNIEAGNKLALTKANIFSPECISGELQNFSGETYIKVNK